MAAVSVWLQVPAFAYFLYDDERWCMQTGCWSQPSAAWMASNLLVYGLPVVLGVLLWRGFRVAALLIGLAGGIVIFISGMFAVVYLLIGFPLWDVALSRLVIPGELAAITVILIGAAFLWAPYRLAPAMTSPSERRRISRQYSLKCSIGIPK